MNNIDITYSYPIYDDESKLIDKLTVSFQCNKKTRFKVVTTVRHQQKIEIERSHIIINGIRATHLKGWNKEAFWSQTSHTEHRKNKNEFYLLFPNKNTKIVIFSHISSFKKEITIPSCCKLAGLIEKHKKIIPEGVQFYYNNRILNNRLALNAYGIQDGSVIEITTSENTNHTPLGQQMATGSSYSAVDDFEKYILQMKEKIEIVCQIEIFPNIYGSGFLIGDYMIMTNYHVAKMINGLAKAKFLFHSEKQLGFEVDIDKNMVCFSEDPGNKSPSYEKLDYAILRLLPSNISKEQREILKNLNQVGKNFFENALKTFNFEKNQYQQRLQKSSIPLPPSKKFDLDRANIIQHPLSSEKLPLPKQISFRENQIHEEDFFVLHYKSKTSGGSSGSPVIDDHGKWIGLHYSSCIKIEKILIEHHEIICKMLDYKLIEEETTKFHYQKILNHETKHLYIFFGGINKGRCARDSKSLEIITFLEVVSKEFPKPLDLIKKFLKVEVELEHLLCNTAIHTSHIIEDLYKNRSEKLELKNQAGQQLCGDWASKSFYNKYKSYLWGTAAIAISAIFYYTYRASQKKSK